MKVVVTGGSGALGCSVCSRLVELGHEALSFDIVRPPSGGTAVWAAGDVRDGLRLISVASDFGADAIVNLASLLLGAVNRDPRAGIETNSLGMLNALEAARILKLRRFVWASSAAVFAGQVGARLIANDAPFTPQSIYGATKVLNEALADRYQATAGLETVGFRFGLMMSTQPQHPGALVDTLKTELVTKPLSGQPGRLPYKGDVVNWLWTADAARAVVMAVTHTSSIHGVFNIGGDVRSVEDAADIAARLIPGADISLSDTPRGAEYMSGLEYRMDTRELKATLGFEPEWTLEAQLEALVAAGRSLPQRASVD